MWSLRISLSLLIIAIAIQAKRTNASHHHPHKTVRELNENDTPPKFDAVIVGAGWAGIKAAKTLLDSGISSILLLEANAYIGGRSKSANSDGSFNVADQAGNGDNVPLDFGSEWQYISGNEMEDYLRDNGFFDKVDLEHDKDDFQPMEHAQFYMQSKDSFGTIITNAMGDDEASDYRERVWEGFMSFRKEKLKTVDDMDYFSAAEEYKSKFLDDEKDIQYLNLALDFGEIDYTGALDEMSFAEYAWGHSAGFPVHYVSVPGAGYGNIAASFAAPFSDKIKLGAKVTGIDYEDDDNIVISFTSNDVARTVAAKTVLVTTSLGVLKAGTISFNPRLPDWKQDAIDNMGFGLANKCLMQWNNDDDMVWPEMTTGFEIVTPSSDTSGKWTTFFNPSQFKGVPVLEGLIGANDARNMEKQTDDEIMVDVMTNLRAMFPTIKAPDRVHISRWGQEENILGSYAFKVPDRDFDDDALNLQWHIDRRVWFAGEAMSGTWYGTAVGAWETGEEAGLKMAEEIAELGISTSGPPSILFWETEEELAPETTVAPETTESSTVPPSSQSGETEEEVALETTDVSTVPPFWETEEEVVSETTESSTVPPSSQYGETEEEVALETTDVSTVPPSSQSEDTEKEDTLETAEDIAEVDSSSSVPPSSQSVSSGQSFVSSSHVWYSALFGAVLGCLI